VARTARYRCVAAFVDPSWPIELIQSGSCEGEILEAGRGDRGFGYDPLFYVPSLGRTMGELEIAEKNKLSHRAAAFRALAAALIGRAGAVSGGISEAP
jgi:XTP/dITP diphosphohydrolase